VSARGLIPASPQLGYCALRLRRGEELLTTTGIQVAEYRPTEFEVKVQAATSSVVAGEAIRWKVDGSYLEGGAMAGAPVETTLRRERTWFSPPGFEGHITDDSVWQQLEDTRAYATFLESHAESLSALGTMSRTSSSTLEQQTGPERLEFEATVTDVSAQTASARSSVLVHPAAYYPVIESLPSRLVDAPASVHPRVLAVTPEGQRLTGRSLSLSL